MNYTQLERQIINTRKVVSRDDLDEGELKTVKGILARLEKRYSKESGDPEKLGYSQLREAIALVRSGKIKTVKIYSPKLNDEIVVTSASVETEQFKQLKSYSLEEIKLLSGASEATMKSVHLLKSSSGLEGIKVVG